MKNITYPEGAFEGKGIITACGRLCDD